MSLSRSPSPSPTPKTNGRWSSQDLRGPTSPQRRNKPYIMNEYADSDAQWSAARAKSQAIRVKTMNNGLFTRTRNQLSQVLPTFNGFSPQAKTWRDQEKLGRGRWNSLPSDGRFATLRTFLGNFLRKFKFAFLILGTVAVLTTLLSQASELDAEHEDTKLISRRHSRTLQKQFQIRWWQ